MRQLANSVRSAATAATANLHPVRAEDPGFLEKPLWMKDAVPSKHQRQERKEAMATLSQQRAQLHPADQNAAIEESQVE